MGQDSVVGITTDRLEVWGLNPGGNEIFHTCPDQPWDPLKPGLFPKCKVVGVWC